MSPALQWSDADHRLKFVFGEHCLLSAWFRAVELTTPAMRLGDTLERSASSAVPLLERHGAVAIPSHPISAAPPWLKITRDYLRYVPATSVHYFIEPMGSFEQYLNRRPRRYRHELLRKLRRFAENGAAIDLRTYRSAPEAAAFYPIARGISGGTYQHRLLDVGLPQTAAFAAEVIAQAEHGQARGYLLFREGTPIAYAYGTIDEDCLRFRFIGYDPAFGDLSPGIVLICEALRSAIGEGRFTLIDFGPGEAQYKRAFATGSLQCATVFMFRRTMRHFLIVVMHRACLAASDGCALALRRLGIKDRIKRHFRSRPANRRQPALPSLALWVSSASSVYTAGAVTIA